MTTFDVIKSKLKTLYESNPNIHMNVSISRPKLCLKNEPVILKGVYSHIFQIEEHSCGFPKYHTVQYAEVMTKEIEILELNNNQ